MVRSYELKICTFNYDKKYFIFSKFKYFFIILKKFAKDVAFIYKKTKHCQKLLFIIILNG